MAVLKTPSRALVQRGFAYRKRSAIVSMAPVTAHVLKQPWVSVQGLLPLYIHPQTGDATTQMVSLGAMGDSYYEYLLKVWIYKGRRSEDDMYRGMWERSMDEMLETLLFKNEESGYTYVAEFDRSGPSHIPCSPVAAGTCGGECGLFSIPEHGGLDARERCSSLACST